MTMRRILPCVLVLFALVMTGCFGDSSDPATNSANKSVNPSNRSNTRANAMASPQPTATVNDRKGNDAGGENKSATDGKGQPSPQPTENTNTPAVEESTAQTPINANASSEGTDQTQKNADKTQKDADQSSFFPAFSWDWIIWGLVVIACVLVVVLIGMGLLHLRDQSRHHLEHHLGKAAAAQASTTREAQKEILDKLSSLSSAQSDTSSRLHDVHTEIRSLARLVRESSTGSGDHRLYASLASSYPQNDPSPPKDEPEFPVSAIDYLDKMTRFANVVRPDFQNGILVNDPDGTGELVVIRDSRQDDGRPLFLVPRHPQFQTKQDFYTYYEKYYECARPSAGDVWIIGPAVVEKVSGGWQLREKGLLEIRS